MTRIALLAIAIAALAVPRSQDVPTEPLHTLAGHEKGVLCVAFSKDGSRLASGGHDNHARVWDLKQAEEIFSFDVKYAINGIAFTPDGKRVVTGSWGTQILDIESEQQKLQIDSQTGFITCIALIKNGAAVISASLDGTAKLHDMESGNERMTFDHGAQINCVAVSADGRRLATGGDTSVRLWDMTTGKETLKLAAAGVHAICFAQNGLALFTAHEDRLVRRWDATGDRKTHLEFKGHTEPVLAMALSPDGKRLATGSADKTVRLWNPESGMPDGVIKAHDGPVHGLAWSADGRFLATSSADKTVKVWKIE